jgi:hypothetical protein
MLYHCDSGTDAVTGQLIVGIRAAGGTVVEITSVPHNFPPHVVEAAKVGISDMNGCDDRTRQSTCRL